jgi:TPR repeat protein
MHTLSTSSSVLPLQFVLLLMLVTVGCMRVTKESDLTVLSASAWKGDNAARRRLVELGDSGNATAQFKLGQMFEFGVGVPEDAVAAVSWYRRAAEQGDREAQYSLGHMFDLGQGVTRDSAQAIIWYKRAADQGLAAAQLTLGLIYSDGDGVPKDPVWAASWYQKAADQGDGNAQANLGMMYWLGDGVTRDVIIAYMWENLAAAQGVSKGKLAREAFELSMTSAQVEAGQKLSRDWKPNKK